MIMKKLFKIEVPEKRNFGLDLLRFIAIFTVLVSHSITVLPSKFQIIHFFITDGVLIFFVLSGFLIGRILIRDFQDGISLHKVFYFWKRRWFRTLPAYVFTIFLIITLSYLYHVHFNKFEVLKTIFFVQNIFRSEYFSCSKIFFYWILVIINRRMVLFNTANFIIYISKNFKAFH